MFTFLYNKFTQDNMYQILSQSGFVDCLSKNILIGFLVHSVHSYLLGVLLATACVLFSFTEIASVHTIVFVMPAFDASKY